MLDPIVRDAIDEILRGAILQNWRFYALVAAAALIASLLANAISSYARKRGETFATKADFEEILRQLEASTKATEGIKASVQHADWQSREWKLVRRSKLEELMDSAYAAEHWLVKCRFNNIFQGNNEIGPDPTDKVKRLSALYFPELIVHAAALRAAQLEAVSYSISAGQQMSAAGQDHAARQIVYDSITPTLVTHFKAVYNAILKLEDNAIELMATIRDS
jgi:hypothetical protein